jgi:methionyl-tRNA synthetase
MIGKEIIRFHAVYWPAFLMAAGLPLPEKIFAHGWLLFEQEKMSKSKGNVAYPEPIVKTLGNDALRYYLLREVVFGQDGNFSRDALITRYNADLANGLGNLASRTLAMIERYQHGEIKNRDWPQSSARSRSVGEAVARAESEALRNYESFDFSRAVEAIWGLVRDADMFLTQRQPWSIATDPGKSEELEDVLYAAFETLRCICVLAHPVIPEATQKIWAQLGQAGKLESARIDQLSWGGLKPGTQIGKLEAVFPRVDKKEASERIEAMEEEIRNPGSTQPAPAAAAGAADATKISIEDFAKVEMRVGVVRSAEKVVGADKLLKVMVDIGDQVRQIVAGIATAYRPEELVGRKVVIVANLAPRKLRGVESNGMIVAASAPDGKPVLCTFTEDVPVGARLK